jgi:hypothetical protein
MTENIQDTGDGDSLPIADCRLPIARLIRPLGNCHAELSGALGGAM